jgi:hypothetical protein
MLERMQELNRTIGQLGERALIEARRTNTPIHYMEPAYGDWIIREFPDGRRELMPAEGHAETAPIPPRI